MHPLKAVRRASVDTLTAAAIAIDVAGVPTLVNVLEQPPSSGAVPEGQLPAIYCYVRSETISPDSMTKDRRSILLDFVLQAKGIDQSSVDQVDDMQIELERTLAASGGLGGLAMSVRPVSSEINVVRGEVVFAARRATFEVLVIASRADPSIGP